MRSDCRWNRGRGARAGVPAAPCRGTWRPGLPPSRCALPAGQPPKSGKRQSTPNCSWQPGRTCRFCRTTNNKDPRRATESDSAAQASRSSHRRQMRSQCSPCPLRSRHTHTFRRGAPQPTMGPASPPQRPLASVCRYPHQTRTRRFLYCPFSSCTSRQRRDTCDAQRAYRMIRRQPKKRAKQGEEKQQKLGAQFSWKSSVTQAEMEKGHDDSCPKTIFLVANLLLLFFVFFLQHRGGGDGVVVIEPQ